MKKTLLLLFVTITSFTAFAQSTADAPKPGLTKIVFGKMGYNASMPDGFTWSSTTTTPDSSLVYTGEKDVTNGFSFGAVAVRYSEFDNSSPDELEEMLITYMDSLKKPWNITKASGYGRNQLMISDNKARGVIDYWTDKDGHEYALKGWISKYGLCVMYIKGPNIYPHTQVQTAYFDSFRFK